MRNEFITIHQDNSNNMETLRKESEILHPEVKPITRQDVADGLTKPRITLPYYSKYEYTALISARAQQLADGARPLVSLEGIKTDAMFVWSVAEKELKQKKLPFIIRRPLPGGDSEFWSAQELEVMW